MKELSIEEKAKRYDKALEIAREWSETKNGYYMPKELCEEIFPELRESEDEKIRKELLQIANESEDSFYMVMTPNKRKRLIAWLEKQGEQKPAWSEEDEYYFGIIQYILNNECVGKADRENATTWFKSLKERVQPQNSSVTDEELAQAKKEAYNEALDKIEYNSEEPTFDDGWSAAIWYLKKRNSKPQNRWKPSDEQMSALSKAIAFVFDSNSDVKHSLESLYNELKKL